jgi:cobalt-zinc-cadmium efflux system membrane fusion protein
MKDYMNKQNSSAILIIAAVALLLLGWILLSPDQAHDSQHDEHGNGGSDEEVEKGPHGGRLLDFHEAGEDFSVEITIYETGLPPEFRVYAYYDEKPLAPDL